MHPNGFGHHGHLDDDGDTVACHECGRRLRSLARHITHAHTMTIADYKHAHGLPPHHALCSIGVSKKMAASNRRSRAWANKAPRNTMPDSTEQRNLT